MGELDILLENEIAANRYAARCLRYAAAAVAALWLMSAAGVFTVPAGLMNAGAAGAIALLALPSTLRRQDVRRPRMVRDLTLACIMAAAFLLTCLLPKHMILAWALPLALSCHYYDRGLTLRVLGASCLLLTAGGFIGMLFGEWDQCLLGWTEEQAAALVYPDKSYPELLQAAGAVQGDFALRQRVIAEIGGIGGSRYLSVLLFYLLPRCFALAALTPICTSLIGRSKEMIARERSLAGQAALADYRATHDLLTGLYNRNKYEAVIEANAYGGLSSCGILYFDVNGLKQTNDTEGHEAGDVLICRAAESLSALVDERCDGYRMGGDEFMLVLKNATQTELSCMREQWEKMLHARNAAGGCVCEMAVGQAFSEAPVSLPALIRLADEDMYEEKRRMRAAVHETE